MPILIKGSGGAQKVPEISVSSSGLITATAGKKSATKQLSSSMDADFVAANIKKGVSIFGVNGALPEYKVADLGANSEHTPDYDELVSISGNSMTLKIGNPDNLVENWASDNLSDVLRHLVISVHSIDRAGGSASQSTAQCNLLIENFFSSDYSLRVVCVRWSRDGTVSEGYYEDDDSANYTCNAEDGSITITSTLISKLYTKYVDVEGVLYTKQPRW